MTDHNSKEHVTKSNIIRIKPSQIYTLYGDVRALSKAKIVSRPVLSQLQRQAIVIAVDLERQHDGRRFYKGPLHLDLDVYFISDLPTYRQKKSISGNSDDYNMTNPHISTLIGLIEKIGEGVLFDDGTHISSVNCTKKYTYEKEPYLTFSVIELKGLQ